MKKSLVSLLLLVAMMFNIFAFTACDLFGGGKVDHELTGVYDGSKVTISFWHTMGQDNRALLEDAIARFREIYPNITVEHKSYGKYDEVFSQIRTKLSNDAQPNLAYCYPDHVATYNKSFAVATLDDLINNKNVVESSGEMMGFTQEQLDDFIEGYYNEGKEYGDGKMYSLPFQKSTEVLYYNKNVVDPIMAELGIESIKTWDHVEAIIKEIKADYPTSIPLGYDSVENFFITLAAQYDSPYTSATGDHYVFNNETNKAFVAKFAEWYQKGLMYSPNPKDSGYTSDAFKQTKEEGKVFLCIGSSAGARYQRPEKVNGAYPFDIGIVPIPQVSESNPKVISQGPSICLFKDENVQETYAAWLFLKFLTTDKTFQAQYSLKSGYVPVIKSVSEDVEYKKYLDKADGGDFITSLVAKVALEQENYYFTSPAFAGSADCRTQVGLLAYAIFNNYDLKATDAVNKAMIDQKFDNSIAECKK